MKIIDSYDTLPLGIYLDIMALCEDAAMEEDDRQLQIISLLTGEDEDTLLFVGRIKGAKCPFDLEFLTWDFS